MTEFLTIEHGAQRAVLDPGLGMVRDLQLTHGGRRLYPLHQAPWLGEAEIQNDAMLLPVERKLAGDFFCAPFGSDGRTTPPTHGWTANSPWEVVEHDTGVSMHLKRDVFGATVRKRVRLAEAAPLCLQHHEITGGAGATTVSHHPMLRLLGSGRLTCSPKSVIFTGAHPPEVDRHVLAYPVTTTMLTAVPGVEGAVDLTRLPIGIGHEDFVTLVEAEGSPLGWTAVVREAEDDVVFVLKDPAVLPITMLWFSNGGRDFAPWNGRHRGVLGIEDACAAGDGGLNAALAPNAVTALGRRSVLPLAPMRTHHIHHVIGAIARPPGWTQVADIALTDEGLRLTGTAGAPVILPFDPADLPRVAP